jgi:hypothetical protein
MEKRVYDIDTWRHGPLGVIDTSHHVELSNVWHSLLIGLADLNYRYTWGREKRKFKTDLKWIIIYLLAFLCKLDWFR